MVARSVTVQIYGEQYTIKSEDDESRVRDIAKLVDEKMREVASSGKVVTTSKIAILAALNIAGELFRARSSLPSSGPPLDDSRLQEAISRLAASVQDGE
jgi:cell division protein ZapA